MSIWDRIIQDLRVAFRTLAKRPGFTIVATLTLALGVGLNTAIFSVLESVVLRPLPYASADRLVTIWTQDAAGLRDDETNLWTMQQWRDRSASIESISMYGDAQFTLLEHGEGEILRGMRVTAQFFETLGVKPLIGRTFAPGEDRLPHEQVIVLGYELWRRRFGADPAIVGRTIQLNAQPVRVIGVLPSDFHPIHMSNPAEIPELFRTADYAPADVAACHSCSRSGRILARLRPSVGASAASNDLTSIVRDLARTYPGDRSAAVTVHAEPLLDSLVAPIRGALWILFGAVALVLLISCTNVAGMQLARATARQREFAVRGALGGSRGRLIAQLLTENLLLAGLGGVLGVITAPAVVSLLVAHAPRELPRLDDVHVDARVLAFALVTTVVTGVVFGLLPALAGSRADLNEVVKRSAGIAGRAAGARLRNSVVVVAMALAFALVAGTGLLVRTLMNLQRVDAGFDSRNVLTLTPAGSYPTAAARLAYLRTLIERVEAVPGVEAAGIVSNVPLSHVETWPIRVDDRPPHDASAPPAADVFWVSPGYFATLRIPLRRGRMLQERDGDPNAEHGALISETLARLQFNGVDPIGHHVQVGPGSPAPTLRIVGVVGDVRYAGLDRSPGAAIYVPQGINANHYTRLVARTSGDPMRLERTIRSAIREIDPAQPVFHVQPMDDYVASSLAERGFALTLVTLFGAVALLLAAIGIYGVVSYSVLQRTAEIGVRVALGATRIDVVAMIMRQAVGLTAGGLAAGAVFTFVSTRFLQSLLFEVRAMDWPTLVITAAIFTAAATIASVIPARSASRVDPLTAIRAD